MRSIFYFFGALLGIAAIIMAGVYVAVVWPHIPEGAPFFHPFYLHPFAYVLGGVVIARECIKRM